jgi:exosortase
MVGKAQQPGGSIGAGRQCDREKEAFMTVAGVSTEGDATDRAAYARWLNAGNITIAVVITGAFIALFHQWFSFQNRFSWGSDDWAHAYVVPLISGYAIWTNRERLAAFVPEVFWPGLAPLALGIVSYFFFLLGFPNHMGQGLSIILAIFGATLLNLGPRFMPVLTFPIAYLFFAVTISERVMQGVTFQLQLIASKGAWLLMNGMGVHTDLAGNTLEIFKSDGSTIPLNVAEACSGMRMVIAFYALGTAIAFLSTKQWWQRIALLLLAGPIAIFVNVLRVASLGVLSLWNPEISKGSAHMFVGLLWLVPAFALFMFSVWALKNLIRDPNAESIKA